MTGRIAYSAEVDALSDRQDAYPTKRKMAQVRLKLCHWNNAVDSKTESKFRLRVFDGSLGSS